MKQCEVIPPIGSSDYYGLIIDWKWKSSKVPQGQNQVVTDFRLFGHRPVAAELGTMLYECNGSMHPKRSSTKEKELTLDVKNIRRTILKRNHMYN